MPSRSEPEAIAPGIWRIELATPLAAGGRLALRTNVYALEIADGLALIDCGGRTTYEQLRGVLARRFPGRRIKRVFLTHAHADHAGSSARCQAEGIEVFVGSGDVDMLLDGGPWGVPVRFRYPPCRPAGTIEETGEIALECGARLTPVAMPGHTAGSFGFVDADRRLLVSGDVTFGPCGPGFAATFLLEVLTSRRQTDAELREHQDTLVRARGRYTASGGWLVLPGHGPVVEAGNFADPFGRARRLLSRIKPFVKTAGQSPR